MFLFAAVFACIEFFSCNDSGENPVPETTVNISLNINGAQYSALQSPGGFVYLTGGVAGIFLYRFDSQTFYAYDRYCPCGNGHRPLVYDEKSRCLLHSDTLRDCNSKYSVLLHGAVISGESKFPLKEYQTVSTAGIVRITNGIY